jgi:hypothetical protein
MSNLVLPSIVLLSLLSSCVLQDAYGREYVLYDRPASSGTARDDTPGPERVFELEGFAAELRAAMAVGLEEDGRIQALLAAIEAECRALTESLGDALVEARRRRVEVLLDRASGS